MHSLYDARPSSLVRVLMGVQQGLFGLGEVVLPPVAVGSFAVAATKRTWAPHDASGLETPSDAQVWRVCSDPQSRDSNAGVDAGANAWGQNEPGFAVLTADWKPHSMPSVFASL